MVAVVDVAKVVVVKAIKYLALSLTLFLASCAGKASVSIDVAAAKEARYNDCFINSAAITDEEAHAECEFHLA